MEAMSRELALFGFVLDFARLLESICAKDIPL
jgi:hypothetical protein